MAQFEMEKKGEGRDGPAWGCWGDASRDLGTSLSPEEAKKWLQVPRIRPWQVPGMNFPHHTQVVPSE